MTLLPQIRLRPRHRRMERQPDRWISLVECQRQRSCAGCDDAQHMVAVVDLITTKPPRSICPAIPRLRQHMRASVSQLEPDCIGLPRHRQGCQQGITGRYDWFRARRTQHSSIPFSPWQVIWTALPGMLRAWRNAARDTAQIPEFVAVMPGWCRTIRATLQNCLDAASLLSREAIHQAWRGTGVQPVARSVALTMADPATKLRLELTNLVGETDANAILSNLSGASGDLASLGPLLGLAKVRDGQLSRAAYMECYGRRRPRRNGVIRARCRRRPGLARKQTGRVRPISDGCGIAPGKPARQLSVSLATV